MERWRAGWGNCKAYASGLSLDSAKGRALQGSGVNVPYNQDCSDWLFPDSRLEGLERLSTRDFFIFHPLCKIGTSESNVILAPSDLPSESLKSTFAEIFATCLDKCFLVILKTVNIILA